MRENEGFIDMDFHFFLIYYIDICIAPAGVVIGFNKGI